MLSAYFVNLELDPESRNCATNWSLIQVLIFVEKDKVDGMEMNKPPKETVLIVQKLMEWK